MPFNRAFREKQRELKAKNKNKRGSTGKDGTDKGTRGGDSGEGPFQDSQDIHCKGMTTHITGKLDKYGNWRRD